MYGLSNFDWFSNQYVRCLFQALKVEMIQFLVGLLDTNLESVEKPSATKAQIVKALKAMQRSLKYGDEVGCTDNT